MPPVFIPPHFLGNILIRKCYFEVILKSLIITSGIAYPLQSSPVATGLNHLLNLLAYTSVATHDIYENQGLLIASAEADVSQIYMNWLNTVQNNPSPENFRLGSVVHNQFLPFIEQIMQFTPISIPESSSISEGIVSNNESILGSESSLFQENVGIIHSDSLYQLEISIPQKLISWPKLETKWLNSCIEPKIWVKKNSIGIKLDCIFGETPNPSILLKKNHNFISLHEKNNQKILILGKETPVLNTQGNIITSLSIPITSNKVIFFQDS